MTHFGIICLPANGHLNPSIALGYELKSRGHRVSLVGIPDVRTKAEEAELEFLQVGEREFPIGSLKKGLSQLGKLTGLAAIRYGTNLLIKESAMVLDEAPGIIKGAGIEALLVDQASVGSLVAVTLDLPYISICNAIHSNREISIPPFTTSWQYNQAWWALLRNQLGYMIIGILLMPNPKNLIKYRQKFNVAKRSYYSSLAILTQMPSELDFPRKRLPKRFHFTGPPIYKAGVLSDIPFPWEKLTGQPLIYASMGTAVNQLAHIFKQIATACEGLDVQLVISLGGGLMPEELPELPGNPIVVSYAPQLELLQKATLIITHAGMNTTLESLSYGVPMIAIPITYDHPGIAARIVWTGAGEMIPLKRLNVSNLRKKITKILTEDSYKQNAIRLQEAIKISGRSIRAADIIEQAIATGKPVLSTQFQQN
ncbi:MAG: glycosyltransferase [Cyanobacteria bacterium P01_H01_bin.35]